MPGTNFVWINRANGWDGPGNSVNFNLSVGGKDGWRKIWLVRRYINLRQVYSLKIDSAARCLEMDWLSTSGDLEAV